MGSNFARHIGHGCCAAGNWEKIRERRRLGVLNAQLLPRIHVRDYFLILALENICPKPSHSGKYHIVVSFI
jgi:hypothetical protein